jgi:hypothetical protein
MPRAIQIRTASDKVLTTYCAVSWKEVSTELYEEIISTWEYNEDKHEESLVSLFGILTGYKFTFLLEAADVDLLHMIFACTKFVYAGDVKLDELPLPATLEIDGKEVTIPKQLGHLTLGQNLHMRKRLSEVKDSRQLVSTACAIYLQPLLDGGKFDSERAEYYEAKIKKMSITKTCPIGFFFLRQQKNFLKEPLPLYNRILRILRNLTSVLLSRNRLR